MRVQIRNARTLSMSKIEKETGALQTGGDFGMTGRWMGRPFAMLRASFRCCACATAA